MKSEYVPGPTKQLLAADSSLPLSPLRVLQTSLPATTLMPFIPARCVKDAIGMHYSDLEFAIERRTRGLVHYLPVATVRQKKSGEMTVIRAHSD